jgi:hypothetical protein
LKLACYLSNPDFSEDQINSLVWWHGTFVWVTPFWLFYLMQKLSLK